MSCNIAGVSCEQGAAQLQEGLHDVVSGFGEVPVRACCAQYISRSSAYFSERPLLRSRQFGHDGMHARFAQRLSSCVFDPVRHGNDLVPHLGTVSYARPPLSFKESCMEAT